MSKFISGLFYKREEVGKTEGSVMKYVGGTRQKGGRVHIPSSRLCEWHDRLCAADGGIQHN